MTVEIRAATEDTFESIMQGAATAFSGRMEPDEIAFDRQIAEYDRWFGAFDDEVPVGAAASLSFHMTVPGGAQLPVAGVTQVGVAPTHRRQGVLTALMRRQFVDSEQHQEPLAALYASEGSIYGRFGYGLAMPKVEIDLEGERRQFVRGYRPSGAVRLLAKDDALPVIHEIYQRAQADRPGCIALTEDLLRWRWSVTKANEAKHRLFAIHSGDDGRADAYAVYQVESDWTDSVPHFTMEVLEQVSASAQGHADIWRFLLDVDLVHRVKAWNRPFDDPLFRLVSEPNRLRATIGDGVFLRILDIATALEARTYRADGRLLIEVEDRFLPDSSGVYELAVERGTATCRRSDLPADIECSVTDLGAAYLGGVSFAHLRAALRIGEATTGAIERADAMFGSSVAPWTPFMF